MTSATFPERGRKRLSGCVRHFVPPLRPIPRGSEYREFQTEDGRRIFIHREVLEDLAALEREEHPNETAGLLFGRFFTDGSNPCTLVRHLIRPLPGEVSGTPMTVTMTAEGSARMSTRAQLVHPCADPVGWAHTHPTFKAYFSGTDRNEQSAWTSPSSVGLVISGLSAVQPQLEVFVGPGSEPTRPVAAPRRRPRPAAKERRPLASKSTPPGPEPRFNQEPRPERLVAPPPAPHRGRLWAIIAAAFAAAVLAIATLAGDPWQAREDLVLTATPSAASLGGSEVGGVSHVAAAVAAVTAVGVARLGDLGVRWMPLDAHRGRPR